ncbi:adenosylmethionine decarboxylase [Sphingomonas sp.]|uniref:adenosylmethionine decarboxylase n=1 Tax=Sphingomonas sp. TaxID=28214 RepID=UPI001B2142B2|nr:adenosylmethionine decarboxylase [Sphingomonas sp.]MBO9713721.1 adenosylmethionine decarboxylase [Sphingomonas sp.]
MHQGHHLIADLEGCSHLADEGLIADCLARAAAAAAATLLEIRLHGFGPGQGVTGVALLAESHISIHTWPEHGSACVDIFLCSRAHDLDAALHMIVSALGGRIRHKTLVERNFGASLPVD